MKKVVKVINEIGNKLGRGIRSICGGCGRKFFARPGVNRCTKCR